MRSHQFEANPQESIDATLLKLRAYLRNRFGKPPLPKKGRQARSRRLRHLAKPWKR